MKLKTAVFSLAFSPVLLWNVVPSVCAQSFSEYLTVSYNGSLVLLASNNGSGADPMQIVPSFGISVAYPILEKLKIEITEDLYFSNYEYNFDKGYPMACTPDNRQAFVLGFVTGFQSTGFFPIGKNSYYENPGTAFRVFGSLTADIRIVIQALGLHPIDQEESKKQVNAIRNYFWGNGRFLFFAGGFGFDFPVNEKFLLGFDIRTWFPLYRLWTDSNIPFIDGWRFGLGLRITPRKILPPPKTPKPRQPIQSDDPTEDFPDNNSKEIIPENGTEEL